MSNKNKFTQIVSWILIVILVMPNIAFAEEPTNLEYIITEPTTDVSAENQLNNLTLDTESEPILQIKVMDPTGTYQIKSLTYNPYPIFSNSVGETRIEEEGFSIISAPNGRYSYIFSSNEADQHGYSDPFRFDIVDGIAYYVESDDISDTLTTPINPNNIITGPVEVRLSEGITIGMGYDQNNQITQGNIGVYSVKEDYSSDFITFIKVKSDGRIVLPKKDGQFRIIFYPLNYYDQGIRIIDDQLYIQIVGDDVIGAHDMYLKRAQLTGIVKNVGGELINSSPGAVKIISLSGESISYAQATMNITGYTFFKGGLLPGAYKLFAEPSESDRLLGAGNSETVYFTVDSNGFASSETHDLNALTLQYKNLNSEPLNLIDSQPQFYFYPSNYLNFSVNLVYASGKNAQDFRVDLVEMVNGEPIRSIYLSSPDYSWFNPWDGLFSFNKLMTAFPLDNQKQYKIQITDLTKPEGLNAVEFPLILTDKSQVSDIAYLGTDGQFNYHVVNYKLGGYYQSIPQPLSIFDSLGHKIGSGEVYLDQHYHRLLMRSEVQSGANPSYFLFEETATAFENDGPINYSLSPSNEMVSELYITEDSYVVSIYNASFSPNMLSTFELVQWRDGAQQTMFPNAEHHTYFLEESSNFVGGINVIIPKESIEGNQSYAPWFVINNVRMGRYYHYFENSEANVLSANFLDPTGTYAIKDYYVQSINGYQTGEINFDIIDGVFTIRSAANGRYGFYFTSNEADIYGYSKSIIFDVVDGEAYSVSEDDVSTTPAIPVNPDLKINDPLNVLARAGVLIGRAYDHHGVIRPEVGHISVEKRGEDGYYQFVTDMAINVDGTVALPKEDGEYIVILWPFPDRITDAKTVQDVLNVSISEGVVTGARDLKLSPIQLAGMMLDPEGNPLAYDDFWVQIQDAKGNHLMGAQSYYTENGLRYFEVGHLTEGHYRIVGYPNYVDAEHGIYTSEPINFYVNALGVATSSAVTDLKNISLRLRSSVNAPLNLKENITNYTLLRDNAIKVEVKLENVLTRNADDIKVELLIGDDTQGIELQNPVYKSLWPEYENVSGFYAKFDLSDIRLNLSDQYKIRLTDLTKPFGSQSVEFPLVVTTNPMIEYAVSVGNDGDLNYQLVFGSLEQSKVYTVRIFDNSDIQVGAGTIEYDAKYKNMILKSQLQPDSQPTYFRLDDASILFMNTMSDDFNRQAQPYNALWSVEEVGENYVVKIHNESINMVDFKNFEIVKWNEVGRDVVMQSSGNSAVNVETFDDFVDGLKVTFPKTLIDSNQFYGTLVTFGENMIGYGDLFFPNESEALVIATLYDPTGNTQINEVEMWESYRSDGSEYTLSVDHGKAYFDTDTDGEYHFVLYSKGNDDYAYSKAVKIRVIDGKAYYAETPETVMPHDIQVKLQEGVKLGTIYDEYGNPSSNQGYLGINHIDAVGNWTWLGCFMAKSDGSIYVPKADGDYMIFYETWADMTEYIGDEKMYTISSGIITNPFDFYASKVQFSGEIFTDINKPAVYRDFNVGIFDSNDQFVKYARISNSEGKFTYKVGGLPEGDYSYRLEIYDYYVVRGFTNGLPVPFSILADGTAQVTETNVIIPKGKPQVFYSNTEPTNGSVTATLDVGKQVVMLSEGGRQHVFDENGEFEFKFRDFEGNTQIVIATVSNIDHQAPIVIGSNVSKVSAQTGDSVDIMFTVDGLDASLATLNFGNVISQMPLDRTENVANQTVTFSGSILIEAPQGFYELSVLVADEVGNQTYQVLVDNFGVDNTPPEIHAAIANTLTNGFITDEVINIAVTTDGVPYFGTQPDAINQSIDSLDGFLKSVSFDDGQMHTLYFKAIDEHNNTSEIKELTFKWDYKAPAVPTLKVENGATLTNKKTVKVELDVEASRVKILRMTAEGNEQVYLSSHDSGMVTASVTLREGLNTLKVISTDEAGNFSETETTITLDSMAPIIEIYFEPATLENGNQDLLKISTEQGISTVILTINGITVGTPLVLDENGNTSYALTGFDGNINVIATGLDAAGNIGTGRFSAVNVSASQEPLPLSEGITLQSGGFTLTGIDTALTVYTYEVAAADEHTFVSEPIQFELSGNATVDSSKGVVVDIVLDENLEKGYPSNTKMFYNLIEGETSTWIPLDKSEEHGDSLYNGTNDSIYVTVNPEDIQNEIQSATISTLGAYEIKPGHILAFLRHFSGYAVLTDHTAPVVTILTEPLTSPINVDKLPLELSVSEKSTVTLKVDDEKVDLEKLESNFWYAIDLSKDAQTVLEEGVHTFSITAVDAAGNQSSTETFEFVIDRYIELLSANSEGILIGENGNTFLTVTNDAVKLNISAKDTHFKEIIINEGQQNSMTSSLSSFQTEWLLNEGVNLITITAVDLAGNRSELNCSIMRDTTGPTLHLNGLNEGDVISSPSLIEVISGVENDLTTYSWTLLGGKTVVYGTNKPIVIGENEGAYSLMVKGYDNYGNMSLLETHFTVDFKAPEISASAVESISNADQMISISISPFKANTAIYIYKNELQISNNLFTKVSNIESDMTVYTGNFNDEGKYTIVVDTIAGNENAIKTIDFEIDKTAPMIIVEGVNEGQVFTEKNAITFSTSNGLDETVEATISHNGNTKLPYASGTYLDENGAYELIIIAKDRAQNTSETVIKFVVAIPEPEEPFIPNAPAIIPNSVFTQKIVSATGQKMFDFALLDISLMLEKGTFISGTEVIIKRYNADQSNAVIPMVTKKDTVHRLTSNVYKIGVSKAFSGAITLVVPYDESLVGKENKLSIACYDVVNDTWVLVKGKFNKSNNTVTFTTDILSYFMVVESEKVK